MILILILYLMLLMLVVGGVAVAAWAVLALLVYLQILLDKIDLAGLLKDLAGVVLLVFGVVLLFSLVSYHLIDPSINNTGPNVASMASQFLNAFGWLAWGFPLLILSAGWWLLRSRQIPLLGLKLFGWLLVLVALLGLLDLSDLGSPQNGVFYRGGWIGQWLVRDRLVISFNQVGAFILLAALLLVGIRISTFGSFRRRYDEDEDEAEAP